MPSYIWDAAEGKYRNLLTGLLGGEINPDPDPDPVTLAHEWSDTNLPWAYTSTSQFTQDWPSGVQIVDIQTGSSDFYTNLVNTVNAAGSRVVVRLGEGVYHLNQFRKYGSGSNPTYAFGFYIANLQGLLGQGPDKTFVQMDADSVSQEQLDYMATMTSDELGAPIQMGLCRFDGTDANSPILISGVTFRSADQQMLTQKHESVDIVLPQPAPHNGVILFQNSHARLQYVRFQAAGRACNSMPPFETANIGSQYGNIRYIKCEFDGRRSPDLDPAQPRRCGPIMGNNEDYHLMEDCWMHHSNISRYAVNDSNRETTGQYILTRTKAEYISNTRNIDPALNNGQSLGGYSLPSSLGWESVGGTITLNDCIIVQDTAERLWVSTTPQHLQLTSVGRNPVGGRMHINGGEFRDRAHPEVDGFVRIWANDGTHWVDDGLNTTLHMYNKSGQRLQPHIMNNLSPSNWAELLAAELASQGKTPETHYLVMH